MSTKKCPHCESEIQAEAKKCRYCKEWLNADEMKDSKTKEDWEWLLEKISQNQQTNEVVNAEEKKASENKEYTIDHVIKVQINEERAQLKIYSENNEIIVKSSHRVLQINQQEIDISDIEAINYYLDENNIYHFVFETKDEELRFSFDFLNNENAVMEIINFSKQFWEKHILEKAYQDIISNDNNKWFVHICNLFISKKWITKDSSGFIFSFGDLDNSIPWNGLNDYFQPIKAEIHPNAGVEYKIMYDNKLFVTIPLSASNSAIIPELFHKVYLHATNNQTNVLFPPSFWKKSEEKAEAEDHNNNHTRSKIATQEFVSKKFIYAILSIIGLLFIISWIVFFITKKQINEDINKKASVNTYNIYVNWSTINGASWSSDWKYLDIYGLYSYGRECYFTSSEIRGNEWWYLKTYLWETSPTQWKYNFNTNYYAHLRWNDIYITKYSNNEYISLSKYERDNLYFAATVICIKAWY